MTSDDHPAIPPPLPMSALRNFLLLAGGLGLGQGGVFLAMSWLIARGDFARLADFGSAFNFATLAMLLVDGGGLTILARETARLKGGAKDVAPSYAAMTWVRLAIAVVLTLPLVVAIAHAPRIFSAWYAVGALPALFIWAFNASGILDGLRRSGVSGISSSAMFILSAITLVVCDRMSDAMAGLLLGSAVTVGAALAVLAQHLALRQSGIRLRLQAPAACEVSRMGREAVAMLFYTAPGQVLFRVQIVLCSLVLGSTVTGLYIYGRQTVSAVLQLVSFTRRNDFPRLVAHVERGGSLAPRDALMLQKSSLYLAAVALIATLLAASLLRQFLDAPLSHALDAIAILMPLIGMAVVNAALSYGLLAMGQYRQTVLPAVSAVMVALPFSYVGARAGGIAGLSLAEAASQAVNLLLLLVAYRARTSLSLKKEV